MFESDDSSSLCRLLLVWYYTTILGKMVQLTVGERIFLVTTFHQTRSLQCLQQTKQSGGTLGNTGSTGLAFTAIRAILAGGV